MVEGADVLEEKVAGRELLGARSARVGVGLWGKEGGAGNW